MQPKDVNALNNQSAKIMTRIKDETAEHHSKLESLPYFEALIDHKLPLECYVNQLRALSIVHGVLENELAAVEEERVSAIWDEELRKLPLLEEDLAFFEPRVISDSSDSVRAALDMTEKIRLRREEDPITLLGYLYVFEGSTLGNDLHRPDISATFHLNGLDGSHYYSSYQDQVQSHWQAFSNTVNIALTEPTSHEAIIEAAHEAFSGLEALYSALYPPGKSEKSIHVTRINPEAGNHPMPKDEREIRAALKASDRGWGAFAYYEERYGRRGKRFSDSDTCWLATLTPLDQSSLLRQVDWLCRLLATRGMPTLMMEYTLRYLYVELSKELDTSGDRYGKFNESADHLKEARENVIPDSAFRRLSGEFDHAVGAEMAARFHNTGQLLVAAVADETNGIEGCVKAIREWLTDADRFSTEWISAVNTTIKKARESTV